MKDWLAHFNTRWLDMVLIEKFDRKRLLETMNHDSMQGVRP